MGSYLAKCFLTTRPLQSSLYNPLMFTVKLMSYSGTLRALNIPITIVTTVNVPGYHSNHIGHCELVTGSGKSAMEQICSPHAFMHHDAKLEIKHLNNTIQYSVVRVIKKGRQISPLYYPLILSPYMDYYFSSSKDGYNF